MTSFLPCCDVYPSDPIERQKGRKSVTRTWSYPWFSFFFNFEMWVLHSKIEADDCELAEPVVCNRCDFNRSYLLISRSYSQSIHKNTVLNNFFPFILKLEIIVLIIKRYLQKIWNKQEWKKKSELYKAYLLNASYEGKFFI